jgi:hypothetical protein
MKPPEPKLTFVFQMRATVGVPIELGTLPNGLTRRIINVTGGTFEGPSIKGKVLEGGSDWQFITPDNVAVIDARYTLQTDQGHVIYINNQGFRHGPAEVLKRVAAGEAVDPTEYYFRTSPRLEAAAPELQWVNKSVFVCSAAREKNAVIVDFYRID